MSPSEARALIGRTLTPAVRTVSTATISFVVKGISGDSFRVRTAQGADSRALIADVAQALDRGFLTLR